MTSKVSCIANESYYVSYIICIFCFHSCWLWSPYGIGQTIIFLPCGYYLSFFISSPHLSGRRLDVYDTSTHGVALVRINNACLKCAARGSLEIQDAKNRHFGTIAQLCRDISSELRHVSTIGKRC